VEARDARGKGFIQAMLGPDARFCGGTDLYSVDERDRVTELTDVPPSSVGAPLPLVIGDEHRLVLAYYVEESSPGRDGSTIRGVHRADAGEPVALVRFKFCYAHMFGPPNDEAFDGHPLASRGLHPYGAFEVSESSWIRRLERMNSVHPHHRPDRFWRRRHLIFAFHDATFECVCDGFDVRLTRGSIEAVVPEMMTLLEGNAG
jgi:hypothetical protein